jgi:hypothetical protein
MTVFRAAEKAASLKNNPVPDHAFSVMRHSSAAFAIRSRVSVTTSHTRLVVNFAIDL